MSFSDDLAAGNKIITYALQSPNYAQGSAGWTINRDGSAEFQNVLVRGTITASTIIGSTITGSMITAGDLQSANFSNTAHTGFDLNGTAATDAAGTPANTIQVYTNFQVGPTGGNEISIEYNGSAAAIALATGNAADTAPAGIGVATATVGASTVTVLDLQSAHENGITSLQLYPSPAVATGPGEAIFSTTGTTAPTGFNGVLGALVVGSAAADVWEVVINNENSVIQGTGVGNPPLILGNTYTPQSRLLVSVDEILSITGGATPTSETLYLNTNNAETVAGGVRNPWTRQVFARDTNTYTFNPGTTGTFTHPTGSVAAINFTLPASGIVTVLCKAVFNTTTSVPAGTVLWMDAVVNNITQSTTPYAGSQNNGGQISTTYPVNSSFMSEITLGGSAGAQGGIMGNPGDTMQAVVSFQAGSATGTWTILKQQLSVLPSL